MLLFSTIRSSIAILFIVLVWAFPRPGESQTLHRFHPGLGNLSTRRVADVFPVGSGRVWVRHDMPYHPTFIEGDSFRIFESNQTLLNPYSNPLIGAYTDGGNSNWLVFNRLPGWVEGGFGNSNGGLMRYQNGLFTLFNSLNFPQLSSLRERLWYSSAMEPGGQRVWVAGDSGIRSIDLATFQIRRFFNDTLILRSKAYWRRGLSSKTGVWFQRDSEEWAYQTPEGMTLFDKSRFGLADSLGLADVAFVGSDTFFLTLDRRPVRVSRLWRRNGQTTAVPLSGLSFGHLAAERDQVLWLVGQSGLYAYQNGQFSRSPVYSPAGKTPSRLVVDAAGNKWVATLDSGLFRISNLKANLVFSEGKRQAYCYNKPVSFQAQVSTTGSNTAYTYQWFFGDGSSSTEANPAHFYKWTGRFRIRLRVRDGLGATVWVEDSLKLDFVPPVYLIPNRDTVSVCQQASLSTTSGNRVRWYLPDGTVVDSNRLETTQTGRIWFEAGPSACRNRDTVVVVRKADVESTIRLRVGQQEIPPDDTLKAFLPVEVEARDQNGYCSVLWQINGQEAGTGLSVSRQISEEGEYLYNVESSSVLNCRARSERKLLVKALTIPDRTIGIPNLLSPNGDGKNDVWQIRNLERYARHRLAVFNRWGKKVLDTERYGQDWSGEEGVYFYTLTVEDQEWKGWITVVR